MTLAYSITNKFHIKKMFINLQIKKSDCGDCDVGYVHLYIIVRIWSYENIILYQNLVKIHQSLEKEEEEEDSNRRFDDDSKNRIQLTTLKRSILWCAYVSMMMITQELSGCKANID